MGFCWASRSVERLDTWSACGHEGRRTQGAQGRTQVTEICRPFSRGVTSAPLTHLVLWSQCPKRTYHGWTQGRFRVEHLTAGSDTGQTAGMGHPMLASSFETDALLKMLFLRPLTDLVNRTTYTYTAASNHRQSNTGAAEARQGGKENERE